VGHLNRPAQIDQSARYGVYGTSSGALVHEPALYREVSFRVTSRDRAMEGTEEKESFYPLDRQFSYQVLRAPPDATHYHRTVNPCRADRSIPTCWFRVYAAGIVCTIPWLLAWGAQSHSAV